MLKKHPRHALFKLDNQRERETLFGFEVEQDDLSGTLAEAVFFYALTSFTQE